MILNSRQTYILVWYTVFFSLNFFQFFIFGFNFYFISLLGLTKYWKATQNTACINGYTGGQVYNVADIEFCKLECEKAGPVKCLSVDFLTSKNSCFFNTVDTSTHLRNDACSGYTFSEIGKLALFF